MLVIRVLMAEMGFQQPSSEVNSCSGWKFWNDLKGCITRRTYLLASWVSKWAKECKVPAWLLFWTFSIVSGSFNQPIRRKMFPIIVMFTVMGDSHKCSEVPYCVAYHRVLIYSTQCYQLNQQGHVTGRQPCIQAASYWFRPLLRIYQRVPITRVGW
jgi:hypothetical protein